MKKLYVFGNEYLDEDNLALKVSKHLDNIKIIHCSGPDDLLSELSDDMSVDGVGGKMDDGKIIILDVVKNITEPMIVKDISKLKVNKLTSLHDFDVGYFLNLMKELGMTKEVKIIGIPQDGDAIELSKRVMSWI